jgi:hypothetical protein
MVAHRKMPSNRSVLHRDRPRSCAIGTTYCCVRASVRLAYNGRERLFGRTCTVAATQAEGRPSSMVGRVQTIDHLSVSDLRIECRLPRLIANEDNPEMIRDLTGKGGAVILQTRKQTDITNQSVGPSLRWTQLPAEKPFPAPNIWSNRRASFPKPPVLRLFFTNRHDLEIY